MKKVSKEHYRRIILLFIISFLLINVKSFGKESVWVRPYEIKFNYESGSNNDAITIKNGNNTYVPVPEWKYNGGNAISEKFAYIKDQQSRCILVSFDSNCSSSMHLLIKLTTFTGTSMGNKCSYFICNYTKRSFVPIYLEGSVPDKVGKRDFTWKWEIYAIPNDIVTYCAAASPPINTSHTYYTLLSAPVAPMAEPWASVLDKACTWANGQSTDSNVLNNLATNLYSSSGLIYDGQQSHYALDAGLGKYMFDLTDFLQDWDKADCQDISMFLTILSSSIGGSLTQTRRIGGFFYTKNILPIGNSAWIMNDWAFHQVGWQTNVYDACIKLNELSPYIPINKDINSYKVDLVFECPTCENNWSPQNAFRLGELDPVKNYYTGIK